MRAAAIGCGALLLLGVAFLLWWSRNPIVYSSSPAAFPEVVLRQIAGLQSAIQVEARLSGETEGYHLTEITATRAFVDALGLSAPAGFQEEPLPLTERERRDPDTVEWTKNWNRENVRWVGAMPIHPGKPVNITFSAESPEATTGELMITYERKRALGGILSSATLTLNELNVEPRDQTEPSADENAGLRP